VGAEDCSMSEELTAVIGDEHHVSELAAVQQAS
jgi:hypothetical protein